ncbi:ATP-dependent helicase HrpB [Echinicola pacifica]|uniref:ATP-dependent helicase HrpB n=1 Tax=Echinicola pacifica TaxID=346377 RepID=UPI000361D8E6|nr:ATP-dependent helicase HrpB [Echinicola pacifica]
MNKKKEPLSFDYTQIALPVVEIIPQLQERISNHQTVILHAPPGAGKSTLVPLVLKDLPGIKGKKILMLEPRRLAAKSIAKRMTDLLQEPLGETVGYRIRFEQRITQTTQIEVITEGIMSRLIHADNSLEEVGLVIFDEFHERNIHSDVAMALCREVQQILRPDLKILVMSATLDLDQLSTLLDAPVVESLGKQYPVKVKNLGDSDLSTLPEQMAQAIDLAINEDEGDVLAFLPGQRDIIKTFELLKRRFPEIAIHPLYGMLSPQRQHQALSPDPSGRRKIVLATSIAETSLTIEGVRIVVDSGYGKSSVFDPRSAMSKLVTHRISMDSANQRTGRAGRLGPGKCYRLWSKATEDRMKLFRTPEIVEADLATMVLDLVDFGIRNINGMTWLTPPPEGPVSQALDLLEELGAIQEDKLTSHGEDIRKLPCHPRIAHMLLKAKDHDTLALAVDLAALLEEKDPLDQAAGTDISLRIEKLRRSRNSKGVNRKFDRIEKVVSNYLKIFDTKPETTLFDPFEVGLLLTYAYPERIAHARPGNNAQFKLTNGKIAMMHHSDDLAHEAWISVAQLDARDGMGKIFLAAPLNPRDLAEHVVEEEIVTWDYQLEKLKAEKQWKIGNIVLKSMALKAVDNSKKTKALTTVLQEDGLRVLDFSEDFIQLQSRILSLRTWNPDQSWPEVSTANLLQDLNWIAPYLDSISSKVDFKKLDLKSILYHSLDHQLQAKLGDLAPDKIQVPSGSFIHIHYQDDGSTPVLAVRLQEVFGLLDTPTLNNGKIKVVMHLLSPGYKPVQVTEDLRSFWDHTYFEVKKELKRRYPKHHWPEDPLQAEAVRGVKRKNP